MTALAISPADILHFAHKHAGAGVVLVTLVGIAGSSPRALGAQMAVAADGDYRGSFSGGCIEAAIVAEALAVLDDGETRMVRFGAGSPSFHELREDLKLAHALLALVRMAGEEGRRRAALTEKDR